MLEVAENACYGVRLNIFSRGKLVAVETCEIRNVEVIRKRFVMMWKTKRCLFNFTQVLGLPVYCLHRRH